MRILQQRTTAESVQDWYWNQRITGILSHPVDQRTAGDTETLLEFYLSDRGQDWFTAPMAARFDLATARKARQQTEAAKQAEKQLRDSIPTVLVMRELDEPRQTHVLERGQYDKPTDPVAPGVPTAIAPWPVGEPFNRLGFARWLVAPENPLTPRVAVNRFWRHCFGEGLVRTADDFGTQGEMPTHPELLDWLAVTVRGGGW